MFKPGQLVVISIRNLHYTEDGFITCPLEKNGNIKLYEQIDLNAYPSCDDFKGNVSITNDGDVVTICRRIGRPARINPAPNFLYYDIYEILVHGELRQAFKHNLFPLVK
jgi:hypothetical protein